MSLIFKNSFNQLPKQFYSKIEPEKTNKPKKVLINNSLCNDLNVDYNYLDTEEGINILSGNLIQKDSDPLAMVYAGHQFGNWVPQLGDGRAHLLGEVLDRKGNKYCLLYTSPSPRD